MRRDFTPLRLTWSASRWSGWRSDRRSCERFDSPSRSNVHSRREHWPEFRSIWSTTSVADALARTDWRRRIWYVSPIVWSVRPVHRVLQQWQSERECRSAPVKRSNSIAARRRSRCCSSNANTMLRWYLKIRGRVQSAGEGLITFGDLRVIRQVR